MSEILKNHISNDFLISSFPTPQARYSRASVEAFSVPALKISTTNSLRKDDQKLYLNNTLIADVSEMTIREVCEILSPHCEELSYIEYDEILELPALMLTNIESKETLTTPLTTNPFQLSRLNALKTKGLVNLESKVTPIVCVDTSTNSRLISSTSNGQFFVKHGFSSNVELYYSVQSTSFLWQLNTTNLITNDKSFISKYIEATYAN